MKQSRFKVKVVCGFRKEQEYTINANEAHKAYFLFNHPEKRGTFDNGIAIKGSDIQRIVPDYQATMGWNHTHTLTDDDYNQMHTEGVLQKFEKILKIAKDVALHGELADLSVPLHTLATTKYAALGEGSSYAKQVTEVLSAGK